MVVFVRSLASMRLNGKVNLQTYRHKTTHHHSSQSHVIVHMLVLKIERKSVGGYVLPVPFIVIQSQNKMTRKKIDIWRSHKNATRKWQR